MMMDLLRVCHQQTVYWDQARTKKSTIIWYWCEPDAKIFPGPNLFTSETWDTVHWYGGPIGEDWASERAYYKGNAPGPFTGQGAFCGQLDWFANGCPSDAPPIPRTDGGLARCCFPGGLRGAYYLSYSSAWDRLRPTS